MRRVTVTTPESMSRSPSSTTIGAPFLIHSQRFSAGLRSRVSTLTLSGAPSVPRLRSSSASSSAAASTFAGSSRVIGTITTCLGATRGGSRSPLSSAWVITSAPIRRVEDAPRRRVGEPVAAFRVGELDSHRLGEVRAQVVRCAGLQRLAVLHHRLDREARDRAGEALALGLLACHNRHGDHVLGERAVDLEHLRCLLARLGLVGVGGVALLPEELRRAQQDAGTELPAHDVGPLVDQQRQVAIGVDPLRERAADDRLGGGADDEGLGELAGGHQLPFVVLSPAGGG